MRALPSYHGISRYHDYSSLHDLNGGSRDSYSSSRNDLYSSSHDCIGSQERGLPPSMESPPPRDSYSSSSPPEQEGVMAMEEADLIKREVEADTRSKQNFGPKLQFKETNKK
ncbi:hypothetical protein P7K49_008089 [Saguinus oedipus]|uniref:Uncharacterized protein n=1 Tax=Saguinus oedipus TaxID=9490 RepID=A0ABQ9VWN9_SAGOE|nr:hypothetical protein P7K49_008089 [Saguinus oedipus]